MRVAVDRWTDTVIAAGAPADQAEGARQAALAQIAPQVLAG